MTDDDKGWWDSDEFEDLVARGIIALFEDRVMQTEPRAHPGDGLVWHLPQHRAATDHEWKQIRKRGIYIAPNDRLTLDSAYWHDIDGLPEYAAWAGRCERPNDGDTLRGYIEIHALYRVPRPPIGCRIPGTGFAAFYRYLSLYPQADKGVEGYGDYVALTKSGRVVGNVGGQSKANAFYAAATLNFCADSKFLWNVLAHERGSNVTFGVHQEQIKSLFYARSLPVTESGRRRPILHWVQAHRRRMREGTDVDISKHLRGIEAFEMDGTTFTITNPTKRPQVVAA